MKLNERFVCIAIDMGASNIRIMAGIFSNNQLIYKELHRFGNEIREIEGHERWDITSIFNKILEGLEIAVSEFGDDIKSIGVDSWGDDFVLLDTNGELVEQPVSYRDLRTEGMDSLWESLMNKRETFERTGINFYLFNTLLQLLSMREQGLPPGSANLLFIPNYISYMLCGVMRNELTISSTSQLLSVDSDGWDSKILDLLNIPQNLMGTNCHPGTILGEANHEKLKDHSIKTVAVCNHDTASAIVAVPAVDESFAFISTGTWCIVGMESPLPILTMEALNEGFTNERGYGNSFRFLKNTIGLWLVQGLMNEMPDDTSYEEVESLAIGSQGGKLIVPGDTSFYNPGKMKNAFDDFFRKTDQKLPGDMVDYFRCAYDSLVYSFRYHIEKIEEMTGKSLTSIHLIGGGCRSKYLCSQTANICNRTVISGPVEAATIGNIVVQAIALGEINGLPEARKLVRESFDVKTYEPVPDTNFYDREYNRFIKLRNQVLGL
jgi:rhamnulokinase